MEAATNTVTIGENLVGTYAGAFGIFSALDAILPSSVVYFLNATWNTLALVSLFVSGLLIYGIIYAMWRTGQLAAEQDQEMRAAEKQFQHMKYGGPKNDRWADALAHIDSPNPNDWRLAIIEADIMLEEALGDIGLAGNTIGERLKSASTSQLQTLDDAWRAHKVRNQIAHAGTDFVLTQKLAHDTLNQYKRTLEELGKI